MRDGQGQTYTDVCSLALLNALDLQLGVEQASTDFHVLYTAAVQQIVPVKSQTIIDDGKLQAVCGPADLDVDGVRISMFDSVVNRFLDDAEQGNFLRLCKLVC